MSANGGPWKPNHLSQFVAYVYENTDRNPYLKLFCICSGVRLASSMSPYLNILCKRSGKPYYTKISINLSMMFNCYTYNGNIQNTNLLLTKSFIFWYTKYPPMSAYTRVINGPFFDPPCSIAQTVLIWQNQRKTQWYICYTQHSARCDAAKLHTQICTHRYVHRNAFNSLSVQATIHITVLSEILFKMSAYLICMLYTCQATNWFMYQKNVAYDCSSTSRITVVSPSSFRELVFTVISVLINAVDSSNTAVMRVSAAKVS